MLPVPQILTALPFRAHADRLPITVGRFHREELSAFRRELKHLACGVTEDLSDEQAEARFQRLRTLRKQMRPGGVAPRCRGGTGCWLCAGTWITAEQLIPAGAQASTGTCWDDESGGQFQELVAFLVGAALGFGHGDESRTRPRFTPVFLDEEFVKPGSQFTGRTVTDWQAPGFQLIIGAPLDKIHRPGTGRAEDPGHHQEHHHPACLPSPRWYRRKTWRTPVPSSRPEHPAATRRHGMKAPEQVREHIRQRQWTGARARAGDRNPPLTQTRPPRPRDPVDPVDPRGSCGPPAGCYQSAQNVALTRYDQVPRPGTEPTATLQGPAPELQARRRGTCSASASRD